MQKHVAIGGPDPDSTLERAVAELKTELGSSILLANAHNSKVDSFPPIRSIYHPDKLKEILTLCQHIEANLIILLMNLKFLTLPIVLIGFF